MKVSIAIIITLAFAVQSASSLLASAKSNTSSEATEVVKRVAQGPTDGVYRPINQAPNP